MTTREENERLTRIGPGTPMGNLLRRYWQPVGTEAELEVGNAMVQSARERREIMLSHQVALPA